MRIFRFNIKLLLFEITAERLCEWSPEPIFKNVMTQ